MYHYLGHENTLYLDATGTIVSMKSTEHSSHKALYYSNTLLKVNLIGGYRIRSVVGQKKMDGAHSAPRFFGHAHFSKSLARGSNAAYRK